MSKYKIGVTEAGDAGLDLSWADKLGTIDGAVVITKRVSPEFRKAVLVNKDRLIVHATTTGFGGSIIEPNVPTVAYQLKSVLKLVEDGFPKNKVVIRIDPLIPTARGLETALNVIKKFMDDGFSRYRISVIDMYPHARKRFAEAGLPLPYGDGFKPSKRQFKLVDNMLIAAKEYWCKSNNSEELRIEACAEPELNEPIQCGCISTYDIKLLGFETDNNEIDSLGYQRRGCMCYSGKTGLLEHKKRCEHGCLYCYWR